MAEPECSCGSAREVHCPAAQTPYHIANVRSGKSSCWLIHDHKFSAVPTVLVTLERLKAAMLAAADEANSRYIASQHRHSWDVRSDNFIDLVFAELQEGAGARSNFDERIGV